MTKEDVIDELNEYAKFHKARIDELEEGLRALIQQVEKSNAVDDHGHPLKNLQALHDARKALDEDYDDTRPTRKELEEQAENDMAWRVSSANHIDELKAALQRCKENYIGR